MGREAFARCVWGGTSTEVKALLEAKEIILRGGLRLKIDRATIADTVVRDDDLVLVVSGQELILELGAEEAKKWQTQLLKQPPTLSEKLGVSPDNKAFLIGSIDDADLTAALANATTAKFASASILVAVLKDENDLEAAIAFAEAKPLCHIWCVYGKGKFVTIADQLIRTKMRARGFADNKACSVSERLSATRYRKATA